MYPLQIFDITNTNKNTKIIESNELYIFSPFRVNSQFKLGYHHFIDRTRDALDITKKLETKNEFYYIVNEFEIVIPDYKDSIYNLTQIYFKNKNTNYSKNFYILWEIFFIFNLFDKNTRTISVCSNNNEECTDTINYYSKIILNYDASKFKIININIDQEKEYEYNNDTKNQYLDTITNKTSKLYPSKVIKDKLMSDLIILNCENIYSNNNNNKEFESYKLFLGELLIILSTLNKNGNCVFKIFDTFTLITLKIIYILTEVFENVYITKPMLSRLSNSEKFIICKNYLYNYENKKINNIIKMLEEILKKIDCKLFLNDIFVDFQLSNDFINNFKFINIKLVNQQQILINEIVKYIKENNYFGDKFHEAKNKQIKASEWWISMFFPPSSNIYISNKEKITNLTKGVIEKNNIEKEKLVSNFI
jgi:23S rRNA U2552 (ribose-2'-O)-methylase RlmE/FtsJ